MTSPAAGLAAFALLATAAGQAQHMTITPNASRTATRGSAEFFTGTVFIDPLFSATDQTRATGGHVTFTPGARRLAHTHPSGQVLMITDGVGWVPESNGHEREVRAGDVVWTPPGVKHWHGASSTTSMRHIAIQEMVDGRNVNWMEHVTDVEYGT